MKNQLKQSTANGKCSGRDPFVTRGIQNYVFSMYRENYVLYVKFNCSVSFPYFVLKVFIREFG